MNYRKLYINIITYAKSQNRYKGDGNYYESHHILPKSLFPLWKNRKSNKVLLTAREHFFCHQLLTKIYPCNEMFFACHAFVSRPNADYRITSREYERLKIEFVKRMRPISIACNTGRKHTPEAIEKIKAARLRQTLLGRTNKGCKWSDEAKANMSKIAKARMTPELKEIIKNKTRLTCAKRIRNIETGKVFDCITDVKLWLGKNVQVSNIVGSIKGRKHYAYKNPDTGEPLHWEYC